MTFAKICGCPTVLRPSILPRASILRGMPSYFTTSYIKTSKGCLAQVLNWRDARQGCHSLKRGLHSYVCNEILVHFETIRRWGFALCRPGAAASRCCCCCGHFLASNRPGLGKQRAAYLGPLPWLGPQRSDITLYSWLPSMMIGKKWI